MRAQCMPKLSGMLKTEPLSDELHSTLLEGTGTNSQQVPNWTN